MVHVQAHYQLVLGDDMTKNFRIPLEDAYLALMKTGADLLPESKPPLSAAALPIEEMAGGSV